MTGSGSTVAVLGGSWFIGHAIVEALLADGHRLMVLNRGVTPVKYSGNVTLVQSDRNDRAGHEELLSRLEADWLVDVTAYGPEHTRSVVDACGGRVRGLIHISTMSVYRWPVPCPIPENFPLETDPANQYGFQKADCERVLQSIPGEVLNWIILRLPAVYGPNDPVSRERYFIGNLFQGRPIMIPLKPFLCQNIFVRDVAKAVCRVIRGSSHPASVYNIAGEPFTLEEYVERLGRLVGREPNLVRSSGSALRQARADAGNLPYFAEGDFLMDTKRIRTELGFEPDYTLDRALPPTVKWIRENPAPKSMTWGLPWEEMLSS